MNKKNNTKNQTQEKSLKALSWDEMYRIDGGSISNTHKSVFEIFNFMRRSFD